MTSFSPLLTEKAGTPREVHATLWLHASKPSDVHVCQSLDEDVGDKEKHGFKGDKVHEILSKFQPSSLDHETIQREIHHHLAKHGYYAHSSQHPLVRSPSENKHLLDWSKVTAHKEAKHVGWHSDDTGNEKSSKSPLVAVWSTKHPTMIRDAQLGQHGHKPDGKPKMRPGGSDPKNDHGDHIKYEAGHVAVFDDSKAQHKANSHPEAHDRWFTRVASIRKIPDHGKIPLPSKKQGEPDKHFENTHEGREAYAAAKEKVRDRPKEAVNKWLATNKGHKNYASAEAHAKAHGLHDPKMIEKMAPKTESHMIKSYKSFVDLAESAQRQANYDFQHHIDQALHHAREGDSDTAEEHQRAAERIAAEHFKKTGKKVWDPQGYFGHNPKKPHPHISFHPVSESVEIDEGVEVDHSRYILSHGKKARGQGNWFIGLDRNVDFAKHKEGEDYVTHNGQLADAIKKGKALAKKKMRTRVHVLP